MNQGAGTFGRKNIATLTVVIFAIVACGFARHYSGNDVATASATQQDSTLTPLQLLVDSLYGGIQAYTDLISQKDRLSAQAGKLNTINMQIDDSLLERNNFDLSAFCVNLDKNSEKKARDDLKLIYRDIGFLEREKQKVLADIKLTDDSVNAVIRDLEKAEPVYQQNKTRISETIAKLEGPGYLKVKNGEYYFYIAHLNTDLVRIHNNTKKTGGQSIKDIVTLLKRERNEVFMVTNGGMYTPEFAPQGLLVENFKEIKQLDTLKPDNRAGLNFYIQPNGVFYIDASGFHVSTTDEYRKVYNNSSKPRFATQSGPVLLSNGQRNKNFRNGSSNLNIRSGVGIISRDKIVFVISATRVNFYDFSSVFDDIFNCSNALYLDGAISKMHLGGFKKDGMDQVDEDRIFGPMISVVRVKK